MKAIKPLYSVSETNAHWFNIYYTHYINKLFMMDSIYNFCLLYTDGSQKNFGMVGLQTDNSFLLANNIFATAEEKKAEEGKTIRKR